MDDLLNPFRLKKHTIVKLLRGLNLCREGPCVEIDLAQIEVQLLNLLLFCQLHIVHSFGWMWCGYGQNGQCLFGVGFGGK